MKRADELNHHIIVHAIGDMAIHLLLNLFTELKIEHGTKDRRLRIEHVQHVDKEIDLPRFSGDIISSMQYSHMADDGRWAHTCLEESVLKGSWMFKSLIERQSKVVCGSDWFVTSPIPLHGI